MTTTMPPISLDAMKTKIEAMSKHNQIEILKIIKGESNVSINENKNGVYINLSYMEPAVIDKVMEFVGHVEKQEQVLGNLETQMADYKNTFFKETGDNDCDDCDDSDMMTVYR